MHHSIGFVADRFVYVFIQFFFFSFLLSSTTYRCTSIRTAFLFLLSTSHSVMDTKRRVRGTHRWERWLRPRGVVDLCSTALVCELASYVVFEESHSTKTLCENTSVAPAQLLIANQRHLESTVKWSAATVRMHARGASSFLTSVRLYTLHRDRVSHRCCVLPFPLPFPRLGFSFVSLFSFSHAIHQLSQPQHSSGTTSPLQSQHSHYSNVVRDPAA